MPFWSMAGTTRARGRQSGCWQANVKVLVRSDSHLHTPRGAAKRAVKNLTHRYFIPRFDACLAVGQWSREYFLHYGAQPDRIFLVPHSVENERFANESARLRTRRDKLREQWGLDSIRLYSCLRGNL